MSEKSTKNVHFYWLDLLRFSAALIVVLTHVRADLFVSYSELTNINNTEAISAFFAITRLGNEAVIVFFVLSGFLVGGMVLERIEKGTFSPIHYSINRFARIMPPLLMALIYTAIICWTIGYTFSLQEFIGNLFSLQGIFVLPFGGNAPLWSLSYEVWFYILALSVGVFIKNRSFNLLIFLSLLIPILIFIELSYLYLFIWLIGAFAYFRRPKSLSFTMLVIAILMICYSLIATQVTSKTGISYTQNIISYFPSYNMSKLLLGISVSLFIQQIILVRPKKFFPVYTEFIGRKMAVFSYTLYLTHYPSIMLLQYFGIPKYENINIESLMLFLFVVILSCIQAWILYLVSEKHTNIVKNYLKNIILKYKFIEMKK